MGEVSDGYHTFNELYYYRMLYNVAFFNLLPKEWVHKSKKHHDGEECFGGGWFIVMAELPTGQVSNHYELKDWDLFKVPEKEFADEWDGHTPQEAAERLHKYLQQEHPNNMIQWTGSNLKEVIDFTGKSPRFGEWFNSWEEYENYVHTHNDILKLFCKDGSYYEVPVGSWIVKTPDGYNLPSVAKYIQQEQPEIDFEVKFAEFLERKDAELGAKAWSEEDLRELALYFYYSRNDDKHPEVDLEKEAIKFVQSKEFIESKESPVLLIARHFYELGLNAGKEK